MEKLKVKNHLKFCYFKYESEKNRSIELGDVISQIYTDEYQNRYVDVGVVIQTFANNEFRTDDYGLGDLIKDSTSSFVYDFSTMDEIKRFRPELLKDLQGSNEIDYQGKLSSEIFKHKIVQDYIEKCNGIIFGYLGEADNGRTHQMDYQVERFLRKFTKSNEKIAKFLISSNGRHCVPRLEQYLYDSNNESFEKVLKHWFKTM